MRGVPISYFNYSGGRNTQQAPYLLTDTECRDGLNVHTSLAGDIEKRNGFVTLTGATLTGSPVKATLVHSLFPANTSTKSLLAVVRTATTDSIVKITTAGIASVLKTGLTANKLWYWAQADVGGGKGPIFGLNGTDTPQRWDGAAAETSNWEATTGTVPKEAKYLTYHGSRLWCAEGSRLRFSGITGSSPDPLNWDADDYVDLEPNDGQSITGIGTIGEYLIVFKARKVFKIYDLITGANQQISSEVGCVSHRSIQETTEGLFFLTEDQGVCKTNGATVTGLSEKVIPDFNNVSESPDAQALAAGTLLGHRYYLSVSFEGTRNDHTLEYDLETKSWWLHDCATNEYALLDPGGTPVLYSADSLASARVSKAFVAGVFTDNGSLYAGGSFWTSPWYAWGVGGKTPNPHIKKRINELRVDGVGDWNVFLAEDFAEDFSGVEGEVWQSTETKEEVVEETTFGGAGSFGGAGTFGGEQPKPLPNTITDRRYYSVGLGRAFSIKLTDSSEHNFTINSSTFTLTPRTD